MNESGTDNIKEMPRTAVDMPRRKSKWDLDSDIYGFFEKREAEGQKKYGAGKRNAGYRRDNLMDVLEEVTDAITILGFFEERYRKVADPMDKADVKLGTRVAALREALVTTANETASMRNIVFDYYPVLTKETVKRVVALPLGED